MGLLLGPDSMTRRSARTRKRRCSKPSNSSKYLRAASASCAVTLGLELGMGPAGCSGCAPCLDVPSPAAESPAERMGFVLVPTANEAEHGGGQLGSGCERTVLEHAPLQDAEPDF